MKILPNPFFLLLNFLLTSPTHANGKLSELFEMGYLSAPYHTSMDIGLRYPGTPTTLHIEVSNDPNMVHDGNLPHIGHSFTEDGMFQNYLAETFMTHILGKIKFVIQTPEPAEESSPVATPSMDLLAEAAAEKSVHVGEKRSAEVAEIAQEGPTPPAEDLHPDNTTPGVQEVSVEDLKIKPSLNLLLNIASKTSSQFMIPFASGKDGHLNRGLMTVTFTSLPDVAPASEWIHYPTQMLSGAMVMGIIQATLLSKIKRSVDSHGVKHKGIYG